MSREGKLVLSMGMAPGRPITLKWKATHPRVGGQYTCWVKKESGGGKVQVNLGRGSWGKDDYD